MNRKKWPWIILFLILAIGLTTGMVIFMQQQSGGSFVAEKSEDSETSILLYADETSVNVGEEKTINFTVRIPQSMVVDDVEILDADGDVVTVVDMQTPSASTTDYSEYTFSLDFKQDTAKVYSYQAVMGNAESMFLDIYCTPVITEAMFYKCRDIGLDLQAYVDANALENGSKDACLDAVLQWLEDDERVQSAQINQSAVVYSSVDGVAGIYVLPGSDGYMGGSASSVPFEDSEQTADAYKRFLENGNAGFSQSDEITPVYLDGKNSVTNNKFLILEPILFHEDAEINKSVDVYNEIADLYEEELGYTKYTQEDDINIFTEIIDGNLSQYGIVTMICHGYFLERSDGNFTSLYIVGEFSEDNIDDIWDFTTDTYVPSEEGVNRASQFYNLFFTEADHNADHGLFMLNGNRIYMSSNYLINRYQNLFFDNSLIYIGACDGMADYRLPAFFIDHGAKIVMGYQAPVATSVERSNFEAVFKELLETKKEDNLKSIKEAVDDRGLLKKAWSGFAAVVYHVGELLPENNPVFHVERADGRSYGIALETYSDDFTLKSYGNLTGKIQIKELEITYEEDGTMAMVERLKDADSVEVWPYYFMNQTFENENGVVFTDEDGMFALEDLRYGVYALEIIGENIDSTVSGVTLAEEAFDGGTITVLRKNTACEMPVMIRDGDEEYPASEAHAVFTLISPESYAEKDMEGSRYTADADENGILKIDHIPGGVYELTVTSDDCSVTQTLELLNGRTYIYKKPLYLELSKDTFVMSGFMTQYKDNIYAVQTMWITDSKVQALPFEADDEGRYVAQMAFYNGKLYYTTKFAGTSGDVTNMDINLFRCDPDGSHQEKLASDISNARFVIENDYILWQEGGNENVICGYDLASGDLVEFSGGNGMRSLTAKCPMALYALQNSYYITKQDETYTLYLINDGYLACRTGKDADDFDGLLTGSHVTDITKLEDYPYRVIFAADDAIYTSGYDSGYQNGYLYRYDLKTKKQKNIGSHGTAGGGLDIFFNW